MTNPDYRAMCAELVDVFDNPSPPQYKADVLARARALLAQPEPQPPADGEVTELVEWLRRGSLLGNGDFPESEAKLTRAADLLERLASDNAGLEAAAESAYLDNLSLLDSQDD